MRVSAGALFFHEDKFFVVKPSYRNYCSSLVVWLKKGNHLKMPVEENYVKK